VSRTTYADLFGTIGTTWGAGDGSTTFNVPNLLDRYPRHRNTGAGNRAGAVGTVQADVIKNHQHPVAGNTGLQSNDHTHGFTGTTGTDSPDHTHQVTMGAGSSSGAGVTSGGSFTLNTSPQTVTSAGASARHTHAFSGTTAGMSANHTHAFSATSDFQTGGDPTETRPISATLLFCIRAL
jgi:microcystin-dependent protein